MRSEAGVRHRSLVWGLLLGGWLLWLIPGWSVQAAERIPIELEGVGVTEHLGQKIPLDVQFKDEKGQTVTLGQYFESGKPVILNLAYYNCPMLCSMVVNAMLTGLKGVAYTIGTEFEIVTISIDPRETPEIAAKKKASYLKAYGRVEAENGWHFLTGTEENVQRLAKAVGFEYRWDERQQEYAHPAVLFLLTPKAILSRYLYGIVFSTNDLRLGLLEASEGKIGTTLEKLILFCYHYDPVGKKYALYATNVMKLGGALTVAILGTWLAILWRRERRTV